MKFTWSFEKLEVSANPLQGLDDVILQVHWRCTGTSDDSPPLTETVYGSVVLDSPDPEEFTDFNDITKDQLIEWVVPKIGDGATKEAVENMIGEKIELMRNPPTVSKVPEGWSD